MSWSSETILRRLNRRSKVIGEARGVIAVDRTELDYVRVYASRRSVVGMPLGRLGLPGFAYSYVQVRRGDIDLMPDDDSCSSSATASASFAIARILMLCAASSAIQSRAWQTSVTFGRCRRGHGPPRRDDPDPHSRRRPDHVGLAGVLLVALGLGHIRRTGIVWTLPLSANIVLRNFGLTVFLAQVGIRLALSSPPDCESGLTLVPLGALIVLTLIVVTMIVGRLLGIPVDDLFGIVSGVTGNPGILVYASRAFPHGSARHRLRDDVADGDRREDPVRADRRRNPRRLTGHFSNHRNTACMNSWHW